MATFSDGVGGANNLDSLELDPAIPYASGGGNLRLQLQALLDDKEKQLRLAGTLGQRFLAQQIELEDRISHLNDLEAAKTNATDDNAVESEIRGKLQELKDTMNTWESETQDMFGMLGNNGNGVPPSPPPPPLPSLPTEDTSIVASPSSGPSAAQSSRRAKNAAHRANDVEFAFEIGSSLLTEVRRLQSLLGERDKAIQDMKEEKDDLEKVVENLTTGLRTQEANADKYREENWNLEVTLQELRSQLQDAQTAGQNSEAERKRAAKQLLAARDSIDQHKNEAERLTTTLAEFKAKHETDVAQMRKQAAGLQRDKSDLQSSLEALKSDLAKKDRSIKRFGSPLTPNGLSPYTPAQDGEGDADEDVFGTTGGASNRRKLDTSLFGADGIGSDYADSSPDPSPSRPHLAPNHPSNEIEALKQSLAHAQRQVSMLRGTVQREKELRMDYRRKLAEAEGKDGDFVDVDDEEEENVDPTKLRPRMARGRGRGPLRQGRNGRSALSQSHTMVLEDSPLTDDIDETDILTLSEPTFHQEEQAEDVQEHEQPTVEGKDDVSLMGNRSISADGMDPAFAHVLRPSPSPIPLHGSSPLHERTGAPSRGGRRTRGGAPRLVEQRPSSVVEPVGALAAELGMSEEVLGSELTYLRHVETAEFACQTEPEPEPQVQPEPAPVPDPTPLPRIETCEMAIQTQEVQVQEVVPQVITAEAGLQVSPSYNDASTDAWVTVTSDAQIQTSSGPQAVEMGTQTSLIQAEEVQSTPVAAPANFGGLTRRGTVIPNITRGVKMDEAKVDEAGGVTEADPGTETEGEYTDAREFPATATPKTGSLADFYTAYTEPQESTADFHSVQSGPQDSTSDFYSLRSVPAGSDADDSDQESIKASRFHRTRTSSRTGGSGIGLGYANYQPVMPPQPPPVPPLPPRVMLDESVQVYEMKPEIKDMSIQTDDLIPLIPTTPPTAYGLFRVGSHTQQFQYIAPPSSATSTPAGSPSRADSSRESAATVTAVPRRTGTGTTSVVAQEHDLKPSIEMTVSGNDAARVRTLSAQSLAPLDKTRPPTMMLPPPPRMPPPPTSMPEKKTLSGSSRDMPPPRDIPPPRPTSSPPPELIQRATTPTLLVPSRGQVRQHGSSMPPSQHGIARRPSTNSFRSAANAAAYASVSGATGISTLEAVRRQQSSTSLVSSRQSSLASRPSSMSSDQHHVRPTQGPLKQASTSPRRAEQGGDAGLTTDPTIIHAITQTMIGEFLYKYTRRVVGKGLGEKRHRRFFWVHPYTKTLYWSSADPGSSNVSESSAKSAYIDSVRSVLDPNPMPPGLHQYSVIVSTPHREMKITAPTKERHDIWLNALSYLLARPSNGPAGPLQTGRLNATQPGTTAQGSMRPPTDGGVRKDMLASPRSVRSIGSALSGDSWNVTPRAQRSQTRLSASGSVGKRSGTPAAEYLRLGGPDGLASPSKSDYEYVPGRHDAEDLDFEIHDSIVNGEDFEGLENVRACCDGLHDLGTLSRKPHHHHHHQHHYHPPHPNAATQNQSQEPNEPASRPVSPSAWSFRSRAGSTTSHGGDTGSIWSRFGSKRSKAAPPPMPTSPGDR